MMNANNNDIQQFVEDIYIKCKERSRKRGYTNDLNWAEAVRDMIKAKLSKEKWAKSK
jgi:hypothetical protein